MNILFENLNGRIANLSLINLFTFLFWPYHVEYELSIPNQGSNLHPPHWKHGVLTTESPGKYPNKFHF